MRGQKREKKIQKKRVGLYEIVRGRRQKIERRKYQPEKSNKDK